MFDNLKISFLNIFKIQKKCNFSDLVIFSKHRYIDQINFSEISNFLFKKNKKHLVILNHTSNEFYKIKNLYKTNNIINLKFYLSIIDIGKGFIKFFKNLRDINKLISLLNCWQIRFQIYKLFINFFIKSELWKRIFKINKPKKFLLSYFTNDSSILYAGEEFKKRTEFIGYAFTGLDADSGRYVFHNIDKLLVLGQVDIEILKKLKKLKSSFMGLPKKIYSAGHTRSDYFLNKKKKIKKEKNFTILYIKSNPFYLNNLDDKAIKIFSRSLKNFKNINYIIKDRGDHLTLAVKDLLRNNIINEKSVLKSEFLENLIKKADLCVGTNSTGLLRQAVSLNKPIIQLFAEKHYMYDASNYIISASSEKEIKKKLTILINNKKFYKKYLSKIKKYKKYILSNEYRSNNKIYKLIK